MEEEDHRIQMVQVNKIADPETPLRSTMESDAMAELMHSIARIGIIEPLHITAAGDKYLLVSGHRRLIAAKMAGLTEVPCVIMDLTEEGVHAIRLNENYGREEVNPVDEGQYFMHLLNTVGMTAEELLCHTGKSEAYIKGRIALTGLHQNIQALLRERLISIEAARALSHVGNPGDLAVMINTIRESGASTRTIQGWVQEYLSDHGLGAEKITKITITQPGEEKQETLYPCIRCEEKKQHHLMAVTWICIDCMRAIREED